MLLHLDFSQVSLDGTYFPGCCQHSSGYVLKINVKTIESEESQFSLLVYQEDNDYELFFFF